MEVGKKVIIPLYGGYGRGPFVDDYSGDWKLQFGVREKLRDIDVVMNYFDGMLIFSEPRGKLKILMTLENEK